MNGFALPIEAVHHCAVSALCKRFGREARTNTKLKIAFVLRYAL
jgi:hypothetical protein